MGKRRSRAQDGDCRENQVYCKRQWRRTKGLVEVGSSFRTFLVLSFDQLRPKPAIGRLGVSEHTLAGYRRKPEGNMRRSTVVAVCIKTNHWCVELVPIGGDYSHWAKGIDEDLKSFGWEPSRSRPSLRTELGDRWHALRQQAQQGTGTLAKPADDETERIEREIQRMILSGGIAPGDDLDLWRLANKFDTRPSILTSTLVRLSASGLVESNGVAYRVRQTTRRDAREMMRLREHFELMLLQDVISGNRQASRPAVIAEMAEANESMERHRVGRDPQSFIANDVRFHLALTKNTSFMPRALAYLLGLIRTNSSRILKADQSRMADVIGEHQEIIEAFERPPGDVEAALRRHLSSAIKRFEL